VTIPIDDLVRNPDIDFGKRILEEQERIELPTLSQLFL